MPASLPRNVLHASLIVLVAGCGGGGGTSTPSPPISAAPAPVPAPMPTPTPTPAATPTPTPTPLAGPAGIAQVGEFAVLGYETSFTTTTNGNDRRDVVETFDGTRFRYLASGVHELLLPGFEWSKLGPATLYDSSFSNQQVVEPSGGKSYFLLMLVPGAARLPLSYTGFATWYLDRSILSPEGRQIQLSGNFAYGVATNAGSLPTTGTATFTGFGDVDGYGTLSPITLTVDFATGRLEGRVVPTFTEFGGGEAVSGTFGFASTFAPGATAATADVTLANGKKGTIEIQLTGPRAEELMFRFRGTIPCLQFSGGDCAVVYSGAARRD